MRSCWWAVSLRTSQSSSQGSPLELPLLVSHDTRKGVTVSTRSKLWHCIALEIPFVPHLLPMCAMQHERQWTARYTVGIPPYGQASMALSRGRLSAQRTATTLLRHSGAEGRTVMPKQRAPSDFRHLSPSPVVHPLARAPSVSSHSSKPNLAAQR
ncbi:hypothetical protein B0H13DRAFT_2048746 [Mycena leptocephala]|nr:hypothetical protein B0H13DRAFT_2048746 [Mycena leptocephala]